MNVISIDTPVSVNGITIIPVVKLSTGYSLKGGIFAFIIKQPVAAAIVSASNRQAFRITGEQIPFQQLLDEFPEITDYLEQLPG